MSSARTNVFNNSFLSVISEWNKLQSFTEIMAQTNGKICAKVAFPRYTESVKFKSQSRETASKRKPYRGLGTR